ncbi:MAG: purine-binding chemotaxis protein CheW [Gammaproteobacteria bacterium]|nr:purine-binding chemotaxis protein CheW [Gammaproteobacteria bacterium]
MSQPDLDEISFETEEPQTEQLMTFRIRDEIYGLSILRVQEIRSLCPMTLIPNSPPSVIGMMNLRGAIVPVIDLCQRLSIGESNVSETSVIIITKAIDLKNDTEKTVGLVVDQVREAQSIFLYDLQDAPSEMEAKVPQGSIQGLVEMDSQMTIVLNLDRLFSENFF